MILIYPDRYTGNVCQVEAKAGTFMDLQIDQGNLTLCADACIPHVTLPETFTFHSSPIRAGLIVTRNDGHKVPVFVFQIGEWHWNAPFTLGAVEESRRDDLNGALASEAATKYHAWKVKLRLIESLTQETVAQRTFSAPCSFWKEVVPAIAATRGTGLAHQVDAMSALYASAPTNHKLFKMARKTYLLS